MEPALWELYESGSPDDEVSVIIRLRRGAEPPPAVRIVARFGQVSTARMRRADIVAVRETPGVFSLKASGPVTLPRGVEQMGESDLEVEVETGESMPVTESLSPPGGEDGRGVVVGICDWGLDFTHANFRNADGTTRLQALWDQRGVGDPTAPEPYGYGRLLTRSAINAALAQADPCSALDYYAFSGDPNNTGSHGTHVADILCGNRREPGSEVGLASAADIVFVHLAAPNLSELGNLGDSVGLLEGLDFIRRQAAGRPCVLHLSAGKTGGPHRGNTLLERAVDAMLASPGIALIQSVGNYADAAMHTHARIGPDQRHVLHWLTPRNDRTPNELEIWYSGKDVFDVTLVAPGGQRFTTPLDSRTEIRDGDTLWGNFYHRRREPNSGLNHVDIYLYTGAPSGRWRVVVGGRDVVDGRLHAWIERDASGLYQSRFPRARASSRFTTNTICNCFRAIAVGAYDGTRADRPPTRFSSRGPTADGRQKPEIAAPGYRVRAARSMPRGGWKPGDARLCVKSGTSMAAPWVSGCVALMFAAAGRPLTIHEVRRALIGAADPHPGPRGMSSSRLGYGYLNIRAAVDAARRIGRGEQPLRRPNARAGEEEERVSEEGGWAPVWVEHAAEGADLVVPEDMDATEDEAAPVPLAEAECACRHARKEVAEDGREEEDSEEPEDVELETVEPEDVDLESVELEDVETEDEAEPVAELSGPGEEIEAPFTWEDVRDALESFDEA